MRGRLLRLGESATMAQEWKDLEKEWNAAKCRDLVMYKGKPHDGKLLSETYPGGLWNVGLQINQLEPYESTNPMDKIL
jgi:hypothetical protein